LLTISRDQPTENLPPPKCDIVTYVRLRFRDKGHQCVVIENTSEWRGQSYAVDYNISATEHPTQSLSEFVKSGSRLPRHSVPVPGINEGRSMFPAAHNLKYLDKALGLLFVDREQIFEQFKGLLEKLETKTDVLLITLNEGFLPLFLNWICSCRTNNIKVENYLIVLATSVELQNTLSSHGFHALYHPSFGTYSAEATKAYGHLDFLAMMHMKNIAVWLGLSSGRNVLFQDSDLVWFRDPLPMLSENKDIDATFMSDAGTSRFAPFYANSGFFYLRVNDKTRLFWQRVMTSMDLIYASQSQQVVVNLYLGIMHTLGLSVRVLSNDVAPGGVMLIPNNRHTAQRLAGRLQPYVTHVNWTLNDKEKWKRIRANALSYTVQMENATLEAYTCRTPPPPEEEGILKQLEELKSQNA